MKKGIHSTEFWLSLAAVIISGLLASGLVSNALALQVLGGAGAFLASIGYAGSRAWVKSNAEKGKALANAARLHQVMSEAEKK